MTKPVPDWVREAFVSFMADVKAGQCVRCHAKTESTEKIGRCLYARPCGCRQGTT